MSESKEQTRQKRVNKKKLAAMSDAELQKVIETTAAKIDAKKTGYQKRKDEIDETFKRYADYRKEKAKVAKEILEDRKNPKKETPKVAAKATPKAAAAHAAHA